MKEGLLMEQQLIEQVKARIKQLEEMKNQLETIEKQRKEKWKEYHNFRQNWQHNCKHVFYRIQHFGPLGGYITPTSTYYKCCLCDEHSEKPQDFVATLKHKGCSFYISEKQEKVDLKASLPIPPERQAEVDYQKEKLNELRSTAKCLERAERKLRSQIDSLEKDLTNIAHLLNDALEIPEVIVRKPHRWGPDDFNYDPFE